MKPEKSEQNGKVVEYYDNQKIKFTGAYKDGKMVIARPPSLR